MLTKKGIFVGVLDKAKDSAEVVALVEELRQAILVYQVGVGVYWGRRVLTRSTDVATAVDLQPSCSVDCESLFLVFDSEAKPLYGCDKASFDTLLKLNQVWTHERMNAIEHTK